MQSVNNGRQNDLQRSEKRPCGPPTVVQPAPDFWQRDQTEAESPGRPHPREKGAAILTRLIVSSFSLSAIFRRLFTAVAVGCCGRCCCCECSSSRALLPLHVLSVSVLLLLPLADTKRTLFRRVVSVVLELRPLLLRKLPVRRKLASSVGLCSRRGERTDGVGVVGLRGCGVNVQLLLAEERSAESPTPLWTLGVGDGEASGSLLFRSSMPGLDLGGVRCGEEMWTGGKWVGEKCGETIMNII